MQLLRKKESTVEVEKNAIGRKKREKTVERKEKENKDIAQEEWAREREIGAH